VSMEDNLLLLIAQYLWIYASSTQLDKLKFRFYRLLSFALLHFSHERHMPLGKPATLK